MRRRFNKIHLRAFYRSNRRSTIVAAILLLLFIIYAVVRFALPSSGTSHLWSFQNYINPITAAERAATLQTELQATAILVDTIGALLLVGTLFTALSSIRQTQQSLELNRAQLRVAEEGQITERFTKAIEQLGSDKLAIRLGGIYALERIAKDSPRDHWTVMEVLTAFVRANAPAPRVELWEEDDEVPVIKPATDIQAILTVIGRRSRDESRKETQPLDLSHTDLRGIDLQQGAFQRVIFTGARLERANLRLANLTRSDLARSRLNHAVLRNAVLSSARLHYAVLDHTDISGANLEGAVLNYASLVRSTLIETKLSRAHMWHTNLMSAFAFRANLKEVRLSEAVLVKADFSEAVLTDTDWMMAVLDDTCLEDADLRGAVNFTQEHLDGAVINEQTKLPNIAPLSVVDDVPF
jgi:uncharacterized protein YjbI with pentapeptide repeats